MERRVSELETEVEVLREEVRELKLSLQRVKRELEASLRRGANCYDRGSSYSSVLDSPVRAPSSGSFSLVTGGAGGTGYSRQPSGSDSAQGTQSGVSGSRSPDAVPSRQLTWGEREEICDEIGEWFLRCLRGQHRGSSGCDRIPLSSRVWIVARDFDGFVYKPCQVYHSFSECKHLVKRGSECGESVFIGLPSEREARRVVAAARLGWPSDQ